MRGGWLTLVETPSRLQSRLLDTLAFSFTWEAPLDPHFLSELTFYCPPLGAGGWLFIHPLKGFCLPSKRWPPWDLALGQLLLPHLPSPATQTHTHTHTHTHTEPPPPFPCPPTLNSDWRGSLGQGESLSLGKPVKAAGSQLVGYLEKE